MGIFDAPEARSFLGVPFKALSDEEKAKKAAEAERKKKVEGLVSFQEKLDAVKRLEAEIQVQKFNAIQASPGVFAMGFGSPGLNLGPEGLAGLAQRGGADLASTHARLSKWLTGIDPLELQAASQERKLYVQQNMQLEQHLRQIMSENQLLQRELALTQSVAQRHHHAFDDPFDDGSDPAWDEYRRRQAAAGVDPYANFVHNSQHSHHPHTVHPPPLAHTHTHNHGHTAHAHHPTTCACSTCCPAPAACADPCCIGNCGGGCHPPPPPPTHHDHLHYHGPARAPAPYAGYVPPQTPGFLRARAAENAYNLYGAPPGRGHW